MQGLRERRHADTEDPGIIQPAEYVGDCVEGGAVGLGQIDIDGHLGEPPVAFGKSCLELVERSKGAQPGVQHHRGEQILFPQQRSLRTGVSVVRGIRTVIVGLFR